jgi:hypothetical protein
MGEDMNRTHDGETLAQATDRFSDNLEDPFDRHRASRGREGWRDVLAGHAFVNVLVSWCREDPYKAGHWFSYVILLDFALLGVIVALVWP